MASNGNLQPNGSDASRHADVASVPWVGVGVASGVLGAGTVALLFLGVDLAAGHPLYTPNTLGAALFQGRHAGPDDPIGPALVAGYTAIHVTVFVALGVIAAFERMTGSRIPGPPGVRGLVLAALLFVGFEAAFLGFAAVFAPQVAAELGTGAVATANLVAAGLMAGFIELRAARAEASAAGG